MKLTHTPQEFFMTEQMCLMSYELLIRFRKNVLAKADVTDTIENIFELIKDMNSKSAHAAHVS